MYHHHFASSDENEVAYFMYLLILEHTNQFKNNSKISKSSSDITCQNVIFIKNLKYIKLSPIIRYKINHSHTHTYISIYIFFQFKFNIDFFFFFNVKRISIKYQALQRLGDLKQHGARKVGRGYQWSHMELSCQSKGTIMMVPFFFPTNTDICARTFPPIRLDFMFTS